MENSNSSRQSKNTSSWIAIEGLDGCGKTTQVKKLAEVLNADTFKFPTDRAVIEEANLYSHPLEKALVFAVDMLDTAGRIRATKKDGGIAITDRSIISTYAYQSTKSMWGDYTAKDIINAINIPTLIPDIVIYMRVPLPELLKRIEARAKKTGIPIDSFEKPEYLKRVATQMENTLKILNNSCKIITVDGTLSSEQITSQILKQLS